MTDNKPKKKTSVLQDLQSLRKAHQSQQHVLAMEKQRRQERKRLKKIQKQQQQMQLKQQQQLIQMQQQVQTVGSSIGMATLTPFGKHQLPAVSTTLTPAPAMSAPEAAPSPTKSPQENHHNKDLQAKENASQNLSKIPSPQATSYSFINSQQHQIVQPTVTPQPYPQAALLHQPHVPCQLPYPSPLVPSWPNPSMVSPLQHLPAHFATPTMTSSTGFSNAQLLQQSSHQWMQQQLFWQQQQQYWTNQYLRQQTNRITQPKQPVVRNIGNDRFSDAVLPPSPLVHSHEVLKPTLLVKGPSGFGLKVRPVSQSALVEHSWLVQQGYLKEDKESNGRARRRRFVFWFLEVAASQAKVTVGSVLSGDIIVQIGPHATAGRTFKEACRLFADAPEAADGQTRLSLRLVRQRKQSLVNLQSRNTSLTPLESFLQGADLLKTILDPSRALGAELKIKPGSLTSFWEPSEQWKTVIKNKALEFWRQEWTKPGQVPGWTLAVRTALRFQPQPGRGCRCGQASHNRVHHPECRLYSDLKVLETTSEPSTVKQRPKQVSKGGVLEKAVEDRFWRLKGEQASDEAQAMFVSRMEELQLKHTKQGVLAPSLATMVLSAVVALGSEQWSAPHDPETSWKLPIPENAQMGDDSEDEDDIPLSALCAEKSPAALPLKIRRLFLARLVMHISEKWGHVYREPTHEEYSW